MNLVAPFPWFGGKRRIAHMVWERFGADVPNYVEPFFGSGAVLLGRPGGAPAGYETINDKDGYVANFWRAVARDAETVATYADEPANANDLNARHLWLVERRSELVSRLEGDPDFYDPLIAGYWVWGISYWIGSQFCKSGTGPWWISEEDGIRKMIRLGASRGISRHMIELSASRGISRIRVNLKPQGIACNSETLIDRFVALRDRLRNVRVCCGDWSRVLGHTSTLYHGVTAVLLDPPYADHDRSELYADESFTVGNDVLQWCLDHGSDKQFRIALCGYSPGNNDCLVEHGWDVMSWKAGGGYAWMAGNDNDNRNRYRERIWFSPGCMLARQGDLFHVRGEEL
jgi:hypothetical protein